MTIDETVRITCAGRVAADALADIDPRDACAVALGLAAGAAVAADMSEAEFVEAARLIYTGGDERG